MPEDLSIQRTRLSDLRTRVRFRGRGGTSPGQNDDDDDSDGDDDDAIEDDDDNYDDEGPYGGKEVYAVVKFLLYLNCYYSKIFALVKSICSDDAIFDAGDGHYDKDHSFAGVDFALAEPLK